MSEDGVPEIAGQQGGVFTAAQAQAEGWTGCLVLRFTWDDPATVPTR